MVRSTSGRPATTEGRALPRMAALSFMLGVLALRVCWLPGVNCALAAVSVAVGVVALVQIFRAHGQLAGTQEAITGVVLGVVVLGLSTFFISALASAYRGVSLPVPEAKPIP